MVDKRAAHLLFLSFDLYNLKSTVVFTGPEGIAIKLLPAVWTDQKTISMGKIRRLDQTVSDEQRLGCMSALTWDRTPT